MISKKESLEKRMKEVEHVSEVVHKSQESLVNHISGDIAKNLTWFRKNWSKIKKRLDKNKDGIIQIKELANPWFIKIMLVTLLSISIPPILMTILWGLMGSGWSWEIVLSMLTTIIGPFLIGLLSKFIVDDYDGRLKDLVLINDNLKQKEKVMEIQMINEQNRHAIEIENINQINTGKIHQLEMAVELKKQYQDLFMKEKE